MGQFSDWAGEQLGSFLEGAVTDVGAAIANDTSNPALAPVQGYARRVCDLWARTPALGEDGTILGYDTVCKPYLQAKGEYPLPPEGTATNITVAGRAIGAPGCNAPIQYSVTLDWEGTHSDIQFDRWGGPPVVCAGINGNGVRPVLMDGEGNERVTTESGNVTWTAVDEIVVNTFPGQPRPVPDLPDLPTLPPTDTVFGPKSPVIVLGPTGEITIDLGDGESEVTPPRVGPPVATPPIEGPEVQPNTDDGVPSSGEGDFPPPPDGFYWCGFRYLIVDTLGRGDGVLGTGGLGKIWPKVIANIHARYESGDASVGYSTSVQIRDQEGTITSPCEGVSCNGFRFSIDVGFTISFTPIAAPICCDSES